MILLIRNGKLIERSVHDQIGYLPITDVTFNQKDLQELYRMQPEQREMVIGNLLAASCIVE